MANLFLLHWLYFGCIFMSHIIIKQQKTFNKIVVKMLLPMQQSRAVYHFYTKWDSELSIFIIIKWNFFEKKQFEAN